MDALNIKYKIKTAVKKEIYFHLKECEDNFNPPLGDRVEIKEYSKKIFENSITFEAWLDNILIGLVSTYFNDNQTHIGYITNVSIVKNYMRSGIASKLLNMCITYARQNNFKEIRLEVNESNNNGFNLYKKFNFIKYGEKDCLFFMKLIINK